MYSGVYGTFQWEIHGRTLHVFGQRRGLGRIATFENVNAVNSEQAQWSAQTKIDLNLDMLERSVRERTEESKA